MKEESFLSIYFIDGPPASGKTSLVRTIRDFIFHRRKTTAGIVEEGFMFLESEHEPNTAEYSLEWVENRMAEILRMLKEGKTHIFVDSSPWLAIAYHPEIKTEEIEERLECLQGHDVNFWSLNTSWDTVRGRMAHRLTVVSSKERRRRLLLHEDDMVYMEKRHHSVDAFQHKYSVRAAKYHLLSLAKSVLQ